MKIGIVSQQYPPDTAKGGIGTQAWLKARGLSARGHHVRIISRSVRDSRSVSNDGNVQVIRVASPSSLAHTEIADWVSYSCRVAEELAGLHAEDPFDILDFPEWACEGYVHLLNRAEWNRIPTVVQLHGPLVMLANTIGWPERDSELYRTGMQMEAACLRLADAVFSSSECSANWCAHSYQLDRASIEVIHTGVDTELFRPESAGKRMEPTIVFVGALAENKGIELLVKSAGAVAAGMPGLQLVIVGEGSQGILDHLQATATAAGIGRSTTFLGRVSHTELSKILAAAHVFAAPSYYEGGPGFVYLEAMACGLPVIACSGSGASEVIRNGQNGLLVEPGSQQSLIEALRDLLADEQRRLSMGRYAREFVEREADSRVCLGRLENFYESVVARFRNAKRTRSSV